VLRVLVREPIAEPGLELLRSRFEVVEDGESELGEVIGDYDAIVVRSQTTLDAPLIARATRLKVIGRAGVGLDNVDVDAATRRGIVVANAAESTVDSAAEHAIALLLALARNVPQAHAALTAGTWDRARFTGIELAGKTLGVLGLGRIGRLVARRALGLGMRVVAFDPFVAAERFRELGVEAAAALDDVFAEADVLTLHLPLNSETHGVLGSAAFARMKDGVRIVNAARGELVDEDALVDAIRSGKVAGAALDVFANEPYSGPLLGLPQVVVTPHLAGSTTEAQDRAGVVIAEQVVAALEGDIVPNAVNIPVVDASELELVGPFVPLARTLGALGMSLARGRPEALAVGVYGPLSEHDTRPLLVAALRGMFGGRVDEVVNDVNALVVAAERGVEVSEQRSAASQRYMTLIRVTVRTDEEEVEVAGTTVGPEHRLFLAEALGFAIDIELAQRMAFLAYDDIPGVIGTVGTMFGEAGVNIANMAVSRTNPGGKALMAFSIDSAAPAPLLERVHETGFDDARFVDHA
jgi:D-3-phosphoglycerate dehydrogenase / 2-oxoglutarate reductase